MAEITLKKSPPAGSVFGPEAAASLIGTTVPVFNTDAHRRGHPDEVIVHVVHAAVVDEGRAMELTFDVPDAFARDASLISDVAPGRFSIVGEDRAVCPPAAVYGKTATDPRTVAIKLGGLGGSRIATLDIDGTDLSAMTHAVTVRARNGHVADLTLDLVLLTEEATFDGNATVAVAPATADVLKALGWTPPDDHPHEV